MKTMNIEKQDATASVSMETKPAHFQIYRQTRAGYYTAVFSSDSAVEAVETFIKESPEFDGGEMHIWNNRQKRVCASVKWAISSTEFGFPVQHRADAFYDDHLALIAQKVEEREAIRESVQEYIRITM
jgi:hypothetical protein